MRNKRTEVMEKIMRKVGLCVRYNCNNYGSMLQIVATQKAIEDCGCAYEHIRYNKKTLSFLLKNLNRILNPYFIRGKLMVLQKRKGMAADHEVKKGNEVRLKKFAEYREMYIKPYSPVYKGYSKLVGASANYVAVMVGSDQLWTPAGLQSKFYNLLFVPDDKRKIALATSFGVTEVPTNQIAQTKKFLNRIDFLSVREISGAEIIKNLTGKNVLVALDPTLLYTGKEWLDIFPYKKQYEERYIFAYFLGTNIKHRKYVERFAKKKNLKIITCPAMDEYVPYDSIFGNLKAYNVGPVEFLNLIRGAEYIFTDSFHGTIFSILNHRKFLTFDRYSDELRIGKNSRIDSLFTLLDLHERHYSFSMSLDEIDKKIDYDSVEKKLKMLREDTWKFLRTALDFEGL